MLLTSDLPTLSRWHLRARILNAQCLVPVSCSPCRSSARRTGPLGLCTVFQVLLCL